MSDLCFEDVLADDWGKDFNTQPIPSNRYCAAPIVKKENNDDLVTKEKRNDKRVSDSQEEEEFTLGYFLDEIIDLPVKAKVKKRKAKNNIPLGDVTNMQKPKYSLKGKEKQQADFKAPISPPRPITTKSTIHNTPIPTSEERTSIHTLSSTQQIERMDSMDDGIWMEFDDDFLLLIENPQQAAAYATNNHTSPPPPPQQKKKDIDDLFNSKYQGGGIGFMPSFSTGRGNKLDTPSTQARLSAKSLIASAGRETTPNLTNGSSSSSNLSSSSSPPKNDVDKIVEKAPPANFMKQGFSTGGGNKWSAISTQKLRDAEARFKETDANEDDLLVEFEEEEDGSAADKKRHKSSNSFTSEETDLVLPDLDDDEPPKLSRPEPTPVKSSFSKASGKSINGPSKNGLESANSLFNKGQEDTSKKRLANRNLKYDMVNQLGGFTMGASGKKFDISSQVKRDAISKFESSEESHLEKQPIIPSEATGLPSFSKASKIQTTALALPYRPVTARTNLQKQFHLSSKDTVSPSNHVNENKKTTDNSNIPPVIKRSTNIRKPVISATRAGLNANNKPFKSPVRSKDKLKAAMSKTTSAKAKSTSVFDLTVPKDRQKLSSLGKPLQYTKHQLVLKNIPIPIINMTSSTAKYYIFNNTWGPRDAQKDLIAAGTLPHRTSFAWVENHYAWIVWKMASLVRSWPDQFLNQWTHTNVLNQLLYRYEREMNMGHRPVLKKVLEQDDISIKHMVLVISDIVEFNSGGSGTPEQHSNMSTKYRLQLSDGWYGVSAIVDSRMEKAITKKKLKIGSKLSICGATIIGNKEARSPLEITNHSTMLFISANGCLPAKWDTKLGYHPRKLIMRSIPTIFDDGGTINALDVIVCRKFPILYSETMPNGLVVIRTPKEEDEARNKALQRNGYDAAAPVNFSPSVKSRVPKKEENNKEEMMVPAEDRKVSGYFKLLVCDARSPTDQRWAYLTLSNATEINHIDILEGNRYKVFFLVPYRKNQAQQVKRLHLKTTFSSRWEALPSLPGVSNAYVPRYLSVCNQIPRDRSTDVDLVVLVLQTGEANGSTMHGRFLYHQTLLVTDQSLGVCQIDLHLPNHPFPPNNQQQVLGFMNLKFVLYDERFGITHLKATDESEIISRVSSAPEYIQRGIRSLRDWVNRNPQDVQSVTDRIHDIVQ